MRLNKLHWQTCPDRNPSGSRFESEAWALFELKWNTVAYKVLIAYWDISTAGAANWPETASRTKSSERRTKAGVSVGIATRPRRRSWKLSETVAMRQKLQRCKVNEMAIWGLRGETRGAGERIVTSDGWPASKGLGCERITCVSSQVRMSVAATTGWAGK